MNYAGQFQKLQELDLEIDGLRSRLEQINHDLGGNRQLDAARANLVQLEAQQATAQSRFKDLELVAQELREKATRTEQRLYSGQVKDPKELANLESERQSLQRRRSAMDDDRLEAMITVEDLSEQIILASKTVDQLDAQWQIDQVVLAQERDQRQVELQDVQDKRQQLANTLKPVDLQFYDTLRPRKGNRAVATVTGKVCQACGITIPTGIVSRARNAEELVRCPTCDRILVVSR
jgi:predicted  nucleic acid-binding Zn-ribbon protein